MGTPLPLRPGRAALPSTASWPTPATVIDAAGRKQPPGRTQDIDGLTAYMAKVKAPAAPYAPDTNPLGAGGKRISRVGASATCQGGANTNP